MLISIETIKTIDPILPLGQMGRSARGRHSSAGLTTLSLSRGTRDKLNVFRNGGETWDEFLRRVAKLLMDDRER